MDSISKISVIVPVYNDEKYISRCLESIICQTWENLEIIIINDGSSDTSGEICEKCAAKDSRIILIHQENQGLSRARNNAIDISSGDFLGFVDSDDWIAPDMFMTLYENAITYCADISVCNFKYISESEDFHRNNFNNDYSEKIIVLEGADKISDNVYRGDNFVWNKLYKRYLFDSVRFPENKIFEDVFTTFKLIDKTKRVVISPEIKYFYFANNNGITQKIFKLNRMDIIEAYIERYKYISAKYPYLEKECRRNIFIHLMRCIYKAHTDGVIRIYREELVNLIDTTRCYNFEDCGLSQEEETSLKLLFNDMEAYIIGLRLYNIKLNNVIKA